MLYNVCKIPMSPRYKDIVSGKCCIQPTDNIELSVNAILFGNDTVLMEELCNIFKTNSIVSELKYKYAIPNSDEDKIIAVEFTFPGYHVFIWKRYHNADAYKNSITIDAYNT